MELVGLIEYVSVLFGVTPDQIYSNDRHRNVVDARHVCMLIMRDYTEATMKDIAGVFNKDHSTATHSINKAKVLYSVDKEFRNKVDGVRTMYSLSLIDLPLIKSDQVYSSAVFEEDYLTAVL